MGPRKQAKSAENGEHQSPVYLKHVSNFKASLRRRDSQRFLRTKVRHYESCRHRKSDKYFVVSVVFVLVGEQQKMNSTLDNSWWCAYLILVTFKWPHLSNRVCHLVVSPETLHPVLSPAFHLHVYCFLISILWNFPCNESLTLTTVLGIISSSISEGRHPIWFYLPPTPCRVSCISNCRPDSLDVVARELNGAKSNFADNVKLIESSVWLVSHKPARTSESGEQHRLHQPSPFVYLDV